MLTFGVSASATPSADEATFVPITPCRLADTRPDPSVNVGPRTTPLGPNETYTLQATGTNGHCVIPATATGLALNVTAVSPSAASFMTLFPSDVGRPQASNLNYQAGSPATPNKVDVKLSADGKISVYNLAGTVHLLADVVGYYTHQGLQDLVDGLATKANAADVYTKAQIDTRPFDAVLGGGLVSSAGGLSRSWGDISLTHPATGNYLVTISGVNPCAAGFAGITGQVTLLNVFGAVTPGFASTGFQTSACPTGSLAVSISTANISGAAADFNFQFVLFAGGPGVTGASGVERASGACPVAEPATGRCRQG
jgi:hypothetical protein